VTTQWVLALSPGRGVRVLLLVRFRRPVRVEFALVFGPATWEPWRTSPSLGGYRWRAGGRERRDRVPQCRSLRDRPAGAAGGAGQDAGLPTLPVEKRLGMIDTLLRLSDQRLKLHGLYSKPSSDTKQLPTDPIRLEVTIIPSGNRQMIDDSDEEEYREDGIDAGDVEYGRKISGGI
jgi:hypothetical protein